jgi:cysteine-rich repeat protein
MRFALVSLSLLAACTNFQFAEDLACSDFGTCPPGQFCDPTGDVCRIDLPDCGDGVVDADEVCDDGNRTTGDGCRADCAKAELCGDGALDPQEACDDGNTDGADGCAADCKLEGCGNGVLDDGEQCDDGEANAPTAACLPSCARASCGDGNVEAGVETCDDGAANSDTGACLTSCATATCGDGFVRSGTEACDDGNDIETDACRETCVRPTCGDGQIQIGVELCDPTAAGGCAADCTTDKLLQVAAGLDHTCVLRKGGLVRCWGQGSSGQLGHGTPESLGDDEHPALAGDLSLGALATSIAVGDSHSCAVLAGGTVRCWGTGADGRLGYGNTQNIGDTELPSSVGVVDVGGTVSQLAAGGSHTCALLTSGAVRCWGNGANGRLGYGNTSSIGDTETPASAGDVTVGGAVTQLVAGEAHTCALLTTGAVRCWGNGADGRLGYGTTTSIGDTESPASAGDVPLGEPAVSLAAGAQHTCAILATGALRCWGNGADGRLGYGNTTSVGAADAGDVAVGGDAVQVAAGARHTCALLTTGDVRCWGAGVDGRLGAGSTTTIGDDELPSSVSIVKLSGSPTRIVAGPTHTCVLQTDGDVKCWGTGAGGRLGYGNTANIGDNELPADAGNVFAMGAVTQVSIGEFHTCVIGDAHQVRCWGNNGDGELGYGNTATIGDDELASAGGDVDVGGPVVQLALGSAYSCALLEGGAVRCWGLGARLGYGNAETIGDDETPASAGDLDLGGPAIQIVAGAVHTCAILVGGRLRCWGDNSFGQLGYGNTETIGDDETPASAGDVDAGGPVAEVAIGFNHTCARLTTGAVRCWGFGGDAFSNNGVLGRGVFGSIGDDELPGSIAPVDVGATAGHVAAANTTSCVVTTAGKVRCWGRALDGKLGYANNLTIGDNEAPSAAGDVDVGGTVAQLSAGSGNTCALLATGGVRCWGSGFNGRNGYGTFDPDNPTASNIGDNETPATAGDVPLGGLATQIETGTQHSCAVLTSGRLKCWGSNTVGGVLGYGNADHIGDDETPAAVAPVPVF